MSPRLSTFTKAQPISISLPVRAAPPIVHDVLRFPGQPLDAAMRTSMEPHFGHDFSQLSIHPGSRPPLVVQPKLLLNQADDPYEREAEQISDELMQAQKSPETSLAKSPRSVQGRVMGAQAGLQEAPPLVEDVLRSSGQPLDRSTREFFESHLGYQFGGVRVHSDGRAAMSAQAINAVAYTVGQDVVFGAGRYAPSTQSGRQLLAHELTHVVQQGGTQGVPSVQPKLIQRSLDTYVKAMNQKPRDWYTAAKHLNGEPTRTIRQMLKNLGEPKLIAALHKAAVNGPGVGPCSNVALLTESDYLKVNPGEKPFDRTKCEKPAETKKAVEETFEVQIVSSDKELMETLPEYIDGKVYAVGVRLMDRTYHLFIHGREKPLTIPASWFGQQTEPINTKFVYPSRERALEVIGSNVNNYAYWRTNEDYILPSHFTQSSAPRINTMALSSLEEAGRLGKEVFSDVLIGMVAGKSIELTLRGAGYVISKTLRRLENAPVKPRTGGKAPPVEPPAQSSVTKSKPPDDPYDVKAWEKYYQENPNAKRSVGAAGADDPTVFKGKGTAGASQTGQTTSPVTPVKGGPPYLNPEGGHLGKVNVPNAPTPQMLGQQIENPIRDLVANKYGFKLGSKSPSATGPDIVVPAADRGRVGFDIADVKPLNKQGVKDFWNQLDAWRQDKGYKGKAALFGYDANGNVYLVGIFKI